MAETLADLYRHLHAHPELAFKETATAALIASRMRDLGLEVTEGVGVTGVVALLRNGSGPTVLLRADMDALPMQELTGLPYASKDSSVMHACGHDMHVTCLIGALEILHRDRDQWQGTIMAVFQPAEEGGGGAKAMIDDGLFVRFGLPDVALGQHVTPLPVGAIGYRPGPAMAASDEFHVRLHGRGGHGSRPEATVDPIVMAAATVLRLQTVVSREVSPLDTAVLTVGSLHAGTTSNIIAPEAELKITTRTFDQSVREKLHDAMRRIIRAEAVASNAPADPEITLTMGYPVLINDPEATARTIAAIGAELGQDKLMLRDPVMGAEDFGAFGTAAGIPSCFWFFGGTDPDVWDKAEAAGRLDQDIPSNHSPFFAPLIEPTLSTGVRAMVAAAREWLA